MRKIYSLLVTISFFAFTQSQAQLSVTTNSGSGLAASYPSLAAAITALNGATITSPVVITCASGTETAPAGGYSITATGTAVNTITIQGNGATNSIITAANPAGTAGALNDAIFKLIGSDYVTLSGFAMNENAANTTTAAATNNMVEFGVALLYATATNGAQNNTIQSNNITLNRTYQNTFGIYANATHTATAVTSSSTATGAAGGNSGLKVYSNNISNVNNGITVVGPTAAADHNTGIDIGGSTALTGNTITNYGTTGTFSGYANVSGTVNGILVRNSKTVNISFNNITSSNGGTTAGTLRAIFMPAFSNAPTGTFTNTINNNTVALTHGLSATLQGIVVESTTGTATAALNINANNFTALTAAVASSGTFTAISTAMANLTTNINNNLFTNITTNTTGSFTFISHSYTMPASGSQTISGNQIVTGFNKTGAGGTVTFSTTGTSSPNGTTGTYTNNTVSNITVTGATGITGFNNSDGSGSSPAKTYTGNVMNNWTGGTSTLTGITIAYIGAPSSTVSNNTFTNITGQSTITGITIGSSFSGANPLTIANNVITGLSSTGTGGSVTGITNSNTSTVVNINGNTVNTLSSTGASSTVQGIGVTGATTANVFQNVVNTLTATGSSSPIVQGILVSSGTTLNVYRNKVYDLAATGAISNVTPVQGISVSGGTTVAVFNNLVGDLKAPASTSVNAISGIQVSGGTTVNLHFNTVYINATSSSATTFGTSALYISSISPAVTSRNNILVNNSTPGATGGITAAFRYSATPTNYSTSSNNNLYYAGAASANRVLYVEGTTTPANSQLTIAGVRTQLGGGRETYSISENPTFISLNGALATFLHIDATVPTGIESGGTPVSGVTDDYDADVRNTTFPDMGADEGSFTISSDVFAPAISLTALAGTCATTDRTVTANIFDVTGVHTSGLLAPRIYFKKNNGSYFSAAGTLMSGSASSGVWDFVISTAAMGGVTNGDVVSYFIVAQDISSNNNLGSSAAGVTGTDVNNISVYPASPTVYAIGVTTGSYTVGATGHFTTLTNAVASYNAGCIAGLVEFTLIDATYPSETFPIIINAVAGSSAVNTLTIKPATGVNATISGSSATSIIKLNGADYVTIDGSNNGTGSRNLTLVNTSTATSGNAVIWLAAPAAANGSNNNTIKNTVIEGNAATTTFLGMYIGGNATISLTAAGLENNNNNTVTNNLFRKTQYGLAMFGYAAATPDLNNVVSNNLFGTAVTGEGFNIEGIHTDRQSGLIVSGNDVQNIRSTTGTNIYGIRLLDFKNGVAFNNKVHNLAYTGTSTTKIYGIAVQSSSYITVGNPSNAMIYNNLVYDITSTGTSTTVWNLTGMLASQGYGDKYYYNTIHLTGQLNNSTAGLSAGFANGDENITTGGLNLEVKNNIINVAGTSLGPVWAYYSKATTLAGTVQNYNVLRAAATGTGVVNNVARMNSVNYTTLAAWTTASSQDANSTSADPMLNSATNLIPLPGSPVLNAGTPIAAVTVDILGTTRTGNTTIGAYELAVDETGPAISFLALPVTCSTSDRVLTTTISDAGVVATGANGPRLYYRKDNGAWVFTSGVNTVGNTWTFAIDHSLVGGVSMGNTIYYYVVAQDMIGNLSSMVSGAIGTDVTNITTAPANPNSYLVSGSLGGQHLVGSTAPNFKTLTTAINAYNAGCPVTGPITFSLTDALYSTNETFPIVINPNASASAINTLTIKPFNGVTATITGSAGSILALNGADYVTIDGSNSVGGTSKDLTISNTNAATGTATVMVLSQGLAAGATNNTIKNTIIEAGTRGSSTVTTFGIFVGLNTGAAAGHDNDNLTLQNNTVRRAYYGIQAVGDATGKLDNLVISGNTVGDDVDANSVGLYGMFLSQTNNATVSGNTIKNVLTTDSGNPVALMLSTGFTNSVVSGNNITNVRYTGASGYGGKGIDVNTGSATSNLTIMNNMISEIKGDSWNDLTGDAIVGLRIRASMGGVNLYNNSINLGSGSFTGHASGTLSAAVYVGTSVTALDVRNNIIVNNLVNTTVTAKAYGIYSASANTAFTQIDNNDYYVSGTQGVLGYLGSDQTTLAALTTAFGGNVSSKNVQPVFISSSDLHLVTDANCALDGAGKAILAVTTDIDGDTRNTPPDMGADEFSTTPLILMVTSPYSCSPALVDLTAAAVTAGSSSGMTYTYWTDAAATVAVASPTGVATGNYYIKGTKGSCSVVQPVTATVSPVTVGGTATNNQALCSGGTPVDFNVVGYTGSIVKWQTSTVADFSASVTDIANPTPLIAGSLIGPVTVTTYVRAVVKSGPCNTEYSAPAVITIKTPAGISVAPTAQQACLGADATFTVTAAGDGTITYQWKKDGVDIATATSASYTIIGVTAADVASYSVMVTADCGTATSAGAALTISAATAITTHPASQAVCAGGAVSFTTAGTGTGTLTYQWRKNGSNLAGETAATYTIPSVVAGDAGNYDVIVTGTCGSVTSSAAVLTVSGALNISSSPSPQTVCAGSPASFSITATGTGTLIYQWRRNGVNIGGATAATYSIASTTAAHAGNYDVAVTSDCGTASTVPVSLTVNPVTAITTAPVAQSVCDGTAATFTVVATGTGTLTYQWRKNGTNIPSATTDTYTIPAAASTDAGSYDVVITGGCGTLTSTAVSLTVNPLTVITTAPSAQTVCAGTAASFTVAATGTGTLTYQWRKNGTNIPSATSATYSIATTVAADAANYDVIVTGGCGSLTTTAVSLTVNPVTTISAHPASQNVCLASNVTFTVTAAGSGTLTYQWRKNGANIGGANTSSYSLLAVTNADAGSYDVIVTGGCGSITSNAGVLTINSSVTITTAPTAQTVCANTAASFSVAATGPGVLTYQWRKNGTNIGGAVSATYTIASAVAADAANYDVIITSSCGSETTTPVSLTVNPVTAVTTAPTAQTVCTGAPASFSVTATGTGLTYQWRRNTTNVPGGTAATLNIASATAATAGNYDVVITGTCGTVTTTAVALTITPLTTITVNPVAQGACLGSNATFTVTGAGTGTLTYQWRKGTVNIAGANSATYTITGVTAAHAANYDVVVTGSCGSATSVSVPLTINPSTVITTQPVAQTGCIGGPATFTVAATGTGTLTYQWRKATVNIAGANASSYTISSLTAADAASYDVIVTGACGSSTSNAVALTVNPATVITTQPVAQTICSLNPATFTVAANGTGTLTYQWRKNGVNIAGATSATFTIPSAIVSDGGNYDVIISSTCSALASASVTLTVNACTSIPTVNEDIKSVVLMPNIVTDHAILRVVAKKAMKIDWVVTDAKGSVVMRFSQSVISGQNDHKLYGGQLANGTYYLSGNTSQGKLSTVRFMRF